MREERSLAQRARRTPSVGGYVAHAHWQVFASGNKAKLQKTLPLGVCSLGRASTYCGLLLNVVSLSFFQDSSRVALRTSFNFCRVMAFHPEVPQFYRCVARALVGTLLELLSAWCLAHTGIFPLVFDEDCSRRLAAYLPRAWFFANEFAGTFLNVFSRLWAPRRPST